MLSLEVAPLVLQVDVGARRMKGVRPQNHRPTALTEGRHASPESLLFLRGPGHAAVSTRPLGGELHRLCRHPNQAELPPPIARTAEMGKAAREPVIFVEHGGFGESSLSPSTHGPTALAMTMFWTARSVPAKYRGHAPSALFARCTGVACRIAGGPRPATQRGRLRARWTNGTQRGVNS
jgi:hypothetical protein